MSTQSHQPQILSSPARSAQFLAPQIVRMACPEQPSGEEGESESGSDWQQAWKKECDFIRSFMPRYASLWSAGLLVATCLLIERALVELAPGNRPKAREIARRWSYRPPDELASEVQRRTDAFWALETDPPGPEDGLPQRR